MISSGGEIGRHAGFKPQWAVMSVRVRLPLRVQKKILKKIWQIGNDYISLLNKRNKDV